MYNTHYSVNVYYISHYTCILCVQSLAWNEYGVPFYISYIRGCFEFVYFLQLCIYSDDAYFHCPGLIRIVLRLVPDNVQTVERHFLSAERDGIRKFDFFPSKNVRPSAGLRPATLDIYANQYITAGPFSELYNLIITKVHFLPANNYFTLIYISQTVLLRIQKFQINYFIVKVTLYRNAIKECFKSQNRNIKRK